MISESFTSRSAILTRQGCPRRWWWEYGLPNKSGAPGIVPTRLNMDLLTGSEFYHIGTENLLRGASVDEAVGRALEGDGSGWPGMWPLMKQKGLVLGEKEDAYYVAWEQASLVQALIRAYAIYALPKLHERFDIVEVEREKKSLKSLRFPDSEFDSATEQTAYCWREILKTSTSSLTKPPKAKPEERTRGPSRHAGTLRDHRSQPKTPKMAIWLGIWRS